MPVPLGVDDEAIEASIRKGIEALAAQFNPKNWRLAGPGPKGVESKGGANALCVYALLQAGFAVGVDRLSPRGDLGSALLDGVRDVRIDTQFQTYGMSIRVLCLSLFNRPSDRARLRSDTRLLVNGVRYGGGYGYQPGEVDRNLGKRGIYWDPEWVDNSNSQFGLLGVWAAADAGVEVPTSYWTGVQQYWERTQLPDGQWSYNPPKGFFQERGKAMVGSGRVTMNAAGVASLFVARDHVLATTREDALGKPEFTPHLARAMEWFEAGDNGIDDGSKRQSKNNGYAVFGIERVGLASGFKYFGTHDWYRELAAKVIARQEPGGGWGVSYDDAFNLLFLSRGRHPILFNKLRFDGFWSNRPRDLAGLTPWLSRQLERPLNWQIVNVDTPWHDWLDSPVLYIASHKAPKFTAEQLDKLRNFVNAGGLIFTHADGAMPEFDDYATRLAHDLFPQYEYAALPPSHPIYNLVFKLDWQKLPLRAVSNGSRVLMLHSGKELAKYWQWRDYVQQPEAFRLPANLHVYAAGKRDLRNRLASPYVPPLSEAKASPTATVAVARVRYAGNWDPEPGAWVRFSRLMAYRTGVEPQAKEVKWTELSATETPFAHLTGTAKFVPTDAEVEALQRYVEAGGMLLVDDCGGSGAFTGGLAETLRRAFPSSVRQPLMPAHPLLKASQPGMTELPQPPVLRRYAQDVLKSAVPPIDVLYAGKGSVLVSRLDLTSGLLGTGTWGILGYAPSWCDQFLQNALLWTMDGQATD